MDLHKVDTNLSKRKTKINIQKATRNNFYPGFLLPLQAFILSQIYLQRHSFSHLKFILLGRLLHQIFFFNFYEYTNINFLQVFIFTLLHVCLRRCTWKEVILDLHIVKIMVSVKHYNHLIQKWSALKLFDLSFCRYSWGLGGGFIKIYTQTGIYEMQKYRAHIHCCFYIHV